MRTKTWLVAFGLIGMVGVTSVWTASVLAQDYPGDDEGPVNGRALGGDSPGYDQGSILGPRRGYPAGDARELGPPSGGYPAGEGPELPKPSTGGYPAGEGPALPSASTGGYPAGQGPLPGGVNGGEDGRAQLGEDEDEE